jgi:hypothetical protein
MVQLKLSGGSYEAATHISKRVLIFIDRHGRGDTRFIGFSQVRATRWMHVEQSDHCNRRGDLELNVKT